MFTGQTIRWCVVDGKGRMLASLLTRASARAWAAQHGGVVCRLVVV